MFRELKKEKLYCRAEPDMKENGMKSLAKETDRVSKYGLTARYMKITGKQQDSRLRSRNPC